MNKKKHILLRTYFEKISSVQYHAFCCCECIMCLHYLYLKLMFCSFYVYVIYRILYTYAYEIYNIFLSFLIISYSYHTRPRYFPFVALKNTSSNVVSVTPQSLICNLLEFVSIILNIFARSTSSRGISYV